jgi:type IV pilus assembly protein PilE
MAGMRTIPKLARGVSRGFTLIELMIAVAVVGILTAIAIPSYQDYVRRGAIEEATSSLSSGRTAMEQFFLDNRTYAGGPCPANTDRFGMLCAFTPTAYVITATGTGAMATFVYTINQRNLRTTAGPWGTGNCWIDHKGQTC